MSASEEIFKDEIRKLGVLTSREPCNCSGAFRDEKGGCRHGCSTNLIDAKYELVEHLVKVANGAKRDYCLDSHRRIAQFRLHLIKMCCTVAFQFSISVRL